MKTSLSPQFNPCVTSFSSIALRTNGVEEVYERSCVVGSDGKETKKSKTFCSNKASCWILSLSLFLLLSFSTSLSLDPSVTFHPLILIIRYNHWSSHRMVVNQWNTINFIPFHWFSLFFRSSLSLFLTPSLHGFCSNPSCVICSPVISLSLNSPSTTLLSTSKLETLTGQHHFDTFSKSRDSKCDHIMVKATFRHCTFKMLQKREGIEKREKRDYFLVQRKKNRKWENTYRSSHKVCLYDSSFFSVTFLSLCPLSWKNSRVSLPCPHQSVMYFL